MARIPKKDMNTSFFHIMVQGINKEYIFNSQEDKKKYMKTMKEIKEEIDIMILAYCIMDNHTHILFHEEEINQLVNFMQRVNLLYAKYYNKKYNRVGYVFRDRYKTQPIYTEKHLYSCVKYIHNNPVKANLCDKPEKYNYSSYCKNIFYTNTELEKNVRKIIMGNDYQEDELDEFDFLEIEQNKEERCKEILDKIITKNSIVQDDWKNDREWLKEIVKELKCNYDISFRTIEKVIGIGRETLRKMI